MTANGWFLFDGNYFSTTLRGKTIWSDWANGFISPGVNGEALRPILAY
ncbi:hypothetical protein TPY_1546 [Sulfobacillus acidophilus TPY]|nr:hypothetical protein TPY_1546 [Sulfobacillus acidophilus TPY]